MRSLVLFVVLWATWLAWSGHGTPFLMGAGALSCLAVVTLSRRMGLVDSEGVPIQVVPRVLRYLPWLALEVIKANLEVVRRVLSPSLPISPCVVKLKPSQRTDLCRVIYANSITLTPGTVSIEAEGGTITVHAISREAAEALEQGDMDRAVTRVEGRA